MALRFVEQLSQTEVAKRLGISQMHVSRLQRAAVSISARSSATRCSSDRGGGAAAR